MDVTPAEAKALAKSAYVFTYPLVASYSSLYAVAIDSSPRARSGGFGRWLHERSATTLYSSSWVDARSEPWIVRFPAADVDGPRTSRTSDLWGFTIDEVASPAAGRTVMLVPPTWEGDVQGDVLGDVDRVVRGDSAFVFVESRMWMSDRGDTARAAKTLEEFRLEPLIAHFGPSPPPPVEWPPYHRGAEAGDEFWSLANFALSLTTPHPQDREMLDRISSIGVVGGQAWDVKSFSADVAEAISDGIDDAVSDLLRAAADVGDPALLHRSRHDTDRDYFNRALGSLRAGPLAMPADRIGKQDRYPTTCVRSVADGGSPYSCL